MIVKGKDFLESFNFLMPWSGDNEKGFALFAIGCACFIEASNGISYARLEFQKLDLFSFEAVYFKKIDIQKMLERYKTYTGLLYINLDYDYSRYGTKRISGIQAKGLEFFDSGILVPCYAARGTTYKDLKEMKTTSFISRL